MTIQNIGLFQAIGAKMGYLDQRQRVLAENIANADTPDYKARDLSPVDFGRVLKSAMGDEMSVNVETTNPMHITGAGDISNPREQDKRKPYEIAPDGNAVILEEQMVSSSRTMMDYNLMTSLYQKNVNMIRTALGRGG